jgi:hypothetical protein
LSGFVDMNDIDRSRFRFYGLNLDDLMPVAVEVLSDKLNELDALLATWRSA